MNKQTADYISLKPLADRFRAVADSITDEEIENMIREELRETIKEQISNTDIGTYRLDELIESWFNTPENSEFVLNTIQESVKSKLYEKEKRW